MREGGVEMESTSVRKGQRPFQWIVLGCLLVFVLLLVSMFVYPGGTNNDPTTRGYLFTKNFFSDLGRTIAHNGNPNIASAALFFMALVLAGLAVLLFSVSMLQFFKWPRSARLLSWIGTASGVVSGLGYVGIAFAPANLLLDVHILLVQVAFLGFFLFVIFYLGAILVSKNYPNRDATFLAGFAVILAGYLWLLFFGPGPETPIGLTIQATGQKIVVYAMILTVFFEADRARRLAENATNNLRRRE
jgi:hypothetical protein